jgi:hypothetical protein
MGLGDGLPNLMRNGVLPVRLRLGWSVGRREERLVFGK